MIAYNQRTLVLGPTGCGKSTLLNVQLAMMRCQRAVYDSKDEWAIPGVEPVRGDVDELDWRQPLVHYIPGDDARADCQRFFGRAFERVHLVVAVHELADLCEYNANATPPAANRYIKQGRAWGRGLLAASQRPVEMPRAARTEAEHVFVFPGLDGEDLATVQTMVGERCAGGRPLAGLIDAHEQRFGEHAFIYFDKPGRRYVLCPPLPEHLRNRSAVRRRSVA